MVYEQTTLHPVRKAIWYIESHLDSELSLERVATIVGASGFSLTRAFGLFTGQSLMRYVRARRLTEAARTISLGAPDLLAIALESGYGSHEAFTRAFREQFGVTPEAVRAQGHLHNISVLEPIKMDDTPVEVLGEPRLQSGPVLLLAGISERYSYEASARIPAQWQRLMPYLGSIQRQRGRATYGVCYNGDDAGNIDYLCGVEVEDFSRIPAELSKLRIPVQNYAMFAHNGHVGAIRRTWNAIFERWLPGSGYQLADGPQLERYGESFDPVAGLGDIEIWIPIVSA